MSLRELLEAERRPIGVDLLLGVGFAGAVVGILATAASIVWLLKQIV